MDESDSKIKVSSFFERVDSIDKVANSALSKSKGNFDIINNQKALVNSINVSIEALETKVRDIANFIIIEKKLEKDAEEDRLFEQQDESQKGSMLERLAGLKSNNESEQTQAAGEEPKKGGGILGTLLTLGIGAFALKFLWPAILPAVGGLLKGALAKFAIFSIGGIGSLIKSLIVATGLTGIGVFGIGKMFQKFGDSAENRGNKIAKSAADAINKFKFNKDGKVDGAESLNVEGGGESGGESGKENLVNGDKNMKNTLEKKDLIEKTESTYKFGENPEKDKLIIGGKFKGKPNPNYNPDSNLLSTYMQPNRTAYSLGHVQFIPNQGDGYTMTDTYKVDSNESMGARPYIPLITKKADLGEGGILASRLYDLSKFLGINNPMKYNVKFDVEN